MRLKCQKKPNSISIVLTDGTYLISISRPIWRRGMRGKTQKMKKIEKKGQKPTSLQPWEGEMGLKSRTPQMVRPRSLLNVLSKFQLPTSIWRGDRRGTSLFQGLKEGKSHIPLPNWLYGLIFLLCYTTCDFLSIGLANFAFLTPQHPSSKLGHYWILTQIHSHL